MLAYIVRRLLLIIPTLSAFFLITFWIMPGAPAARSNSMIANLEGFENGANQPDFRQHSQW